MEAVLAFDRNILFKYNTTYAPEEEKYIENFAGMVITDFTNLDNYINSLFQKSLYPIYVYLCGDISEISDQYIFPRQVQLFVIQELSYNFPGCRLLYTLIELGQVPINIHNVGILFRQFFTSEKCYFNSVESEHQFQTLTESNKESNAFRNGIYLSHIMKEGEVLRFNLLRCSTNFDGPTDNFRQTDFEIVYKVNDAARQLFVPETRVLNHVLAQIYNNSEIDGKEKKAKIKEHSDKTKDIPKNSLIAFCSFYRDYSAKSDTFGNFQKSLFDKFDYWYNDKSSRNGKPRYMATSVLTRLRFRLKHDAPQDYCAKFEVILYPNSVFLIPFSTNRLYTHEIVPPILPIDKIPTRMGYVIRSSKTDAFFKNGQTYIIPESRKFTPLRTDQREHEFIKLQQPTEEEIQELKELYRQENSTAAGINYKEVNFSLNRGDYMRPLFEEEKHYPEMELDDGAKFILVEGRLIPQ